MWLQVAGLQEEHLAMLRFSYSDISQHTSFENSHCIGKAWSYNLFKLRPGPYEGFLSQTVGKKNIQNSCEDFNLTGPWTKIDEIGGPAVIFESGVPERFSYSRAWKCKKEKEFSKGISLLKMKQPSVKNPKFFHHQANDVIEPGKVYYDLSCKNGPCHSSLLENVKAVFDKFEKDKNRYVFILKDYSYYSALKTKQMMKAREILSSLEKIHSYLISKTNSKQTIVLVTSTSGQSFEFPKRGKQWVAFEKNGKPVIYRRSSLISPVFAHGAGAENFCGVFDESEISGRLLFIPKEEGFSFKKLFPFL